METTRNTRQSKPPTPLPGPTQHLSFNAEFQELIDSISGDKIQEEYSIFSHLSRLSRDFKSAALQYGKTIISEKYLSDDTKTVKVSRQVGGEAGGEKYIVHGNIMFNFSTDRQMKENLYENDGMWWRPCCFCCIATNPLWQSPLMLIHVSRLCTQRIKPPAQIICSFPPGRRRVFQVPLDDVD